MAAPSYRTATKTITFPSFNNGEIPFAFVFHDTSTYIGKSFGEYFTVSDKAPAQYASIAVPPDTGYDCWISLTEVTATSATFSLKIYTATVSPDYSKFKAGPIYVSQLNSE